MFTLQMGARPGYAKIIRYELAFGFLEKDPAKTINFRFAKITNTGIMRNLCISFQK